MLLRFAEIDNNRVEAAPELKDKGAVCPVCKKPVIAKCGTIKEWHWAHKNKSLCDEWYENKTDWHRMWQNYFEKDFQEVVHYDTYTGERHIADVETDKGFVYEFQHSYITPEERASREAFYKKMIWVVDGTANKREYQKLKKRFNNTELICNTFYTKASDIFPEQWLRSNCIVAYDFLGLEDNKQAEILKQYIYCIKPKCSELEFVPVPRKDFIESIKNSEIHKLIDKLWYRYCEAEKQRKKEMSINLKNYGWFAFSDIEKDIEKLLSQ